MRKAKYKTLDLFECRAVRSNLIPRSHDSIRIIVLPAQTLTDLKSLLHYIHDLIVGNPIVQFVLSCVNEKENEKLL